MVDNGSRDGTVDMLKAEFPSIPYLALPKNIGFGAASNRGIENCHSDHVFLINADEDLSKEARPPRDDKTRIQPPPFLPDPEPRTRDSPVMCVGLASGSAQ